MISDTREALIDKIYEAAVIPDAWPLVLDGLAGLSDCDGGFLLVADAEQSVNYTSTERYAPMMREYVEGGWMQRCPRASRVLPLCHNGFLTDFDIATPDEIATHPYYTEFLRPNHGGWAAGTAIPAPSGEIIVFNLERAHSRGPIDRSNVPILDYFRPHLARAGLLAARLGLQRARAMTDALKEVGLPAAVLKTRGKVYAANAPFEALMPDLIDDQSSRLVFSDPAIDRLFLSGLDAIDRRVTGPQRVCSIPVPARAGRVPMIVHLLPVSGNAQDVFSAASKLIIVTPVDRAAVPNAEVIGGLFDLTPAEARVARQIGLGETVEEIARASGLSGVTIRNQLKSVFCKTGVGRQSDLVALLSGSGLSKP